MAISRSLVNLLEDSVRARPEKVAVVSNNGERVTYAQLGELSDRIRDRLHSLEVGLGDRVGLRLRKSALGVALLFGILKAGAAYVPVDADSPAARAAYILTNCRVKVIVTEKRFEAELAGHMRALGRSPAVLTIECADATVSMADLLTFVGKSDPEQSVDSRRPNADSLAYILYTSGSTGTPKGVMLSHRNALSFVDWCSETFAPVPDDTFSSHAPFHFDLSVFDIYVSVKHGATVVLIDEEVGKQPMRLAQLISHQRISIWYSTPSILGLLASYGKLNRFDHSALRLVLFAGEVFPVRRYLALRAFWGAPRFFNLYGPTETNVCTWYEVRDNQLAAPFSTFPIGKTCPPNMARVVDEQGNAVKNGLPGELVISGPNVMCGYWEMPDQTMRALLIDADGTHWYRTGDMVREEPDVGLVYMGRRDRMVKRRGNRIELGEIEAALVGAEGIREVAVVALPDAESGVQITAYVSCERAEPSNTSGLRSISIRRLPGYMIPDTFVLVDQIPRTSTDKVDYQELSRRATAESSGNADAANLPVGDRS